MSKTISVVESTSPKYARYCVQELSDDHARTYCLVTAVKGAIVNPDEECVAIRLLEVLERRLEGIEQFSELLSFFPERGVNHLQ